jgi:DNA-binding MarR family transcriptional regulator
MNQKHIGIVIIILGIILAIFVQVAKSNEDFYIKQLMLENNSCFLDDGTCLHADRNITAYVVGWVLSGIMVSLGIYLFFFEKTQEKIEQSTRLVSEALKEAKKQEKQKDEFSAFLAGFSEDEQKVLKVIREQEGIKQSTLRYKTDISKTTISIILKSLEERKIVSRKPYKKTKKVFLVKKF